LLQNNKMIEFLRHTFGLCGDGHPSILYLLGIVPFLSFIKTKIILGLKNYLRQIYLYFYRY
jgi:hypothetical protein